MQLGTICSSSVWLSCILEWLSDTSENPTSWSTSSRYWLSMLCSLYCTRPFSGSWFICPSSTVTWWEQNVGWKTSKYCSHVCIALHHMQKSWCMTSLIPTFLPALCIMMTSHWDCPMEGNIILCKVECMTWILALATTNLPQLDQFMDRWYQHFLHLGKLWETICTWPWIDIVGWLPFWAFLTFFTSSLLYFQVKPLFMPQSTRFHRNPISLSLWLLSSTLSSADNAELSSDWMGDGWGVMIWCSFFKLW